MLPQETLTNILHYFPRKQLVKRYSRVNSSFFNVANRLLPNVHTIHEDNIKFYFTSRKRDNCVYPHHQRTQSFYCLILREDRNEIRYSAEELLANMPPAFIRFPSFSIGFPGESIFQFLEQAKQHFVNSRICLSVEYSDGDECMHRRLKLFTDILLDVAEIEIGIYNAAPETFFKTNGVRKCDKVEMKFGYCKLLPQEPHTKQSTEAFIEWLEWKQHESGSRRHLVIYRYDRSLELIEALIQAFKLAAKPLNYVVTFIVHGPLYDDFYKYQFVKDLAPLELENDSTAERLSFFHHRWDAYRLWRRIVNDNGENNDQLDKSFYNYRYPAGLSKIRSF